MLLGASAVCADERPREGAKTAPAVKADNPAAKTESYKIYSRSEKQRTRLTDPSSGQPPLKLPGSRQSSMAPGAKIYRQNRVGTLGDRSVRGAAE